MFRGMRRGRGDACLSDLRLDAWLARDLQGEEARALRRHLAECARCRRREALLARERAEFERTQPGLPSWLEPSVGANESRRGSAWLVASACAAAAALLVFVGVRGADLVRPDVPLGLRVKGTDSVSFYVKRGDEVRRGASRESVRAGDRLRFAYTSAGPRYLAILSLDGARHASVYYPAAAHAARVDAGNDVLLPSAIELDEVLGEERIVALFCAQPLELEPVRRALEARRAAPPPPTGCSLDQLTLIKEAKPP